MPNEMKQCIQVSYILGWGFAQQYIFDMLFDILSYWMMLNVFMLIFSIASNFSLQPCQPVRVLMLAYLRGLRACFTLNWNFVRIVGVSHCFWWFVTQKKYDAGPVCACFHKLTFPMRKFAHHLSLERRELTSLLFQMTRSLYFLDAIASPSTYPCQWVGQSVIHSFRLEITIASPSFASLFWCDSIS